MILNPRILPRTIAALAVLTAISLTVAFQGVLRNKGGVSVTGRTLSALLLPLILVPAALRHSSADYADLRLFRSGTSGMEGSASTGAFFLPEGADGAGVGVAADVGERPGTRVGPENPELLSAVDSALAELDSAPPGPAPPDSPPDIPDGGAIAITDDRFDAVVGYLWDNPQDLAGRTVTMTAFVYRRPGWQGNHFVAARMLIWCCVADAMVIGVLVDTGESRDVPTDRQWIEIEGTLKVTSQFDAGRTVMQNVPTLVDIRWRPVAPPENGEYVFPANAVPDGFAE
jgi:uncharacterized repeat protein (TIGR03943 family)